MIYLLLLINIGLLVLGQTLWKIGLSSTKMEFTLSSIIRVMSSSYILTGLIAYVIATFIWFYILSRSKLSLIYPLQSIGYAAAAFVGLYIFHESIPPTRWAGIGLIIVGAFFVSMK
jgi:drug/metabolite transporter (DMT)-like permease